MAVKSKTIFMDLGPNGDMADISQEVQAFVSGSGLKDGIATIFSVGSTGAVSTIEYEPGLKKDLPAALERIAPHDIPYAHHNTWHDDNGCGHVRATVVGPSVVVPFTEGKLALGTWQQVVIINLDTSHRKREILIQVMGE